MKNFNWDEFRAKLLMRGKTIKEFCQENGVDLDRYRNIRLGRVNAKEEEMDLFKNFMMNGDSNGKKQDDKTGALEQ